MKRIKISTPDGVRFVDPERHQAEALAQISYSLRTLSILYADHLYSLQAEPEQTEPEGLSSR